MHGSLNSVMEMNTKCASCSCCRGKLSCCGWVSQCLPMWASVSEWPNHARCWWSLVTVSAVVITTHVRWHFTTCPPVTQIQSSDLRHRMEQSSQDSANPRLVLLFSGKRKSGKDFITDRLQVIIINHEPRTIEELWNMNIDDRFIRRVSDLTQSYWGYRDHWKSATPRIMVWTSIRCYQHQITKKSK